MRRSRARAITRLYPRAWRERYAEEFEAMLELGPSDARTMIDSLWSALREHVLPTIGEPMEQPAVGFVTVMKDPRAFLPLTMSIVALVLVSGAVAVDVMHAGHVVHESDEGTLAHLWQLLMTVQLPWVLFFAVKWLRRAPRHALRVLGLQAGVWLASCAPVYFLHL